MQLKQHKEHWEKLGDLDPFWAVLSDPQKRFGQWGQDEFFRTGDQEIDLVMAVANILHHPKDKNLVLDFGCGLGRLSRGLLKYFKNYIGVDISENMVKKARTLCGPQCDFHVSGEDLGIFSDNHFDLVYSSIVLQHQPNRLLIKRYIKEFVRVLKPGGLIVFQLPSHIPFKYRLQPVRRVYNFLKNLGFQENFLYNKLKLYPIQMNFISEADMVNFLGTLPVEILKIVGDTHSGVGVQSRTYYLSKKSV